MNLFILYAAVHGGDGGSEEGRNREVKPY